MLNHGFSGFWRLAPQIAKNLKTVFRELVDGGDIEFVMKTAARGAAGAGGKKRARAELTGAGGAVRFLRPLVPLPLRERFLSMPARPTLPELWRPGVTPERSTPRR